MDLISRQTAINAMAELQGRASTKAELKGISKAWKIIKKLPPAQPKMGKWVYQKGMIKCNQCLRAIRRIDHDGLLNFCPNCGCAMNEDEEVTT